MAEVRRAGLALVWIGALVAQAPEVRLEPLATLDAADGVAHAAAFAPDGRWLVLGGERGDVRCIDLPTGAVRWTIAPSDHWIGVLAFAPDGKTLACKGRRLTLHTAHDGRQFADFGAVGPRGFAWRTDGCGFAFADGGVVSLVQGPSEVRSTVVFEYPVNALAYAANGDLFAGDNIGRTWRIPAGATAPTLLREARGNGSGYSFAIGLVHAGGQLFDVASRGPLWRGEAELPFEGGAWSLGVSADGSAFAVGGGALHATWWRHGGAQVHRIEAGGKVNCVAVSPDGASLFVGTADGRQSLHRLGANVVELPGLPAEVRDFALSPDGEILAIKGNGWRVMPVQGGAPRRLPEAVDVRAGRRGSELLICSRTRLALVDERSGVEVSGIDVATGFWASSALGPGERFFCAGVESLVHPGAGERIAFPEELLLHNVCDVASSRDGLWAVGSCVGIEGDLGALWVTDVEGRTLFQEKEGPAYWVAFSPDGRRLSHAAGRGMSMGMGPTSHILCVRDTRDFSVLQQSTARVDSWAWLDDSYALVTHRGGLQVWETAALKAVQTVRTDGAVHRFQTSADRRTIAWSDGRSVFVHRVVLSGR